MSADATTFSATSAAAAIATRRARGDSRLSTECSRPIIGRHRNRARDFRQVTQYRVGMAPLLALPDRLASGQVLRTRPACRSRHAADQRVIDLEDTYRRLAHPWSTDQLAAHYGDADERGAQGLSREPRRPHSTNRAPRNRDPPRRDPERRDPHASRTSSRAREAPLGPELVDTAEKNAADALRRCHRALELDGAARGYTTDEFLPIVYDTAGVLLESADPTRSHQRSCVQTQEAISWLSRAVVELDQDSAEASTALTDTLARLFTVWVFAEAAGDGGDR